MIIIQNKNISETPLELILRLKEQKYISKDSKATYAGRLDPMAKGLTIILTDKDRYNKNDFNNLDKEYEFEILQNIQTDSLDILGKITAFKVQTTTINQNQILNFIKNLGTNYTQKYPKYSSKTFEGVQLHTLAKQNIYPKITHYVKIKSISYISQKQITKKDLLQNIITKIKNINGDFRQEEIVLKWQQVLYSFTGNHNFIIYKFRIKVGSGFYIRQLVDDISVNFDTPMLAYTINRISVGKYNQKNITVYNLYYKIKDILSFL